LSLNWIANHIDISDSQNSKNLGEHDHDEEVEKQEVLQIPNDVGNHDDNFSQVLTHSKEEKGLGEHSDYENDVDYFHLEHVLTEFTVKWIILGKDVVVSCKDKHPVNVIPFVKQVKSASHDELSEVIDESPSVTDEHHIADWFIFIWFVFIGMHVVLHVHVNEICNEIHDENDRRNSMNFVSILFPFELG